MPDYEDWKDSDNLVMLPGHGRVKTLEDLVTHLVKERFSDNAEVVETGEISTEGYGAGALHLKTIGGEYTILGDSKSLPATWFVKGEFVRGQNGRGLVFVVA